MKVESSNDVASIQEQTSADSSPTDFGQLKAQSVLNMELTILPEPIDVGWRVMESRIWSPDASHTIEDSQFWNNTKFENDSRLVF